ncbi:MAG: hypothetical protein R3336_06190, partial [Phycisphaeraceae bacterium]|nr:hypothetical protein [Phycisphaeraceae bacterium]
KSVVDLARSGLAVDVEPVVTGHGKWISVVVRGDVAADMNRRAMSRMITHPWVPPTFDLEGVIKGTIKGAAEPPTEKNGQRNVSGRIHGQPQIQGQILPGRPERVSVRQVELFSQNLMEYRAATEIPDGGGLLLTAMSEQTSEEDERDTEVVMLLRVRVLPAPASDAD